MPGRERRFVFKLSYCKGHDEQFHFNPQDDMIKN